MNRWVTTLAAIVCAMVILALNVLRLFLTFGGSLPGLSGGARDEAVGVAPRATA